jgi:hypothetical protein
MNPLEVQLKSWKPRKPSAKLERMLVDARAAEPHHANRFAWLLPATACLLFAGMAINQRGGTTVSVTSGHEDLALMSLSNQSYAAYLPGNAQSQRNHWATFEWTNGGGFNSSRNPFPRVSPEGTDRK